jgi:hypothetical protein
MKFSSFILACYIFFLCFEPIVTAMHTGADKVCTIKCMDQTACSAPEEEGEASENSCSGFSCNPFQVTAGCCCCEIVEGISILAFSTNGEELKLPVINSTSEYLSKFWQPPELS